MAKKIYGSVNGARKEVTAIYGSVNGARKEVTKVYGSVNGARKLVWEKAQPQPVNDYGILTYYGVTMVPAGTVIVVEGTQLTGSVTGSVSGFFDFLSQQWTIEGHYNQVDWSQPVRISIQYGGGSYTVGQELDDWTSIKVQPYIAGTGYEDWTYFWNFNSYADIKSYISIYVAEAGPISPTTTIVSSSSQYDVDKTTETSFALTTLNMYQTGYNYSSGFNIGTEIITPNRIKSFVFGDQATFVPDGFLRGCGNLLTIDFGNSVIATIGNYFLASCPHFNSALDLSSVTSIGTCFLYQCAEFNSAITLNNSITAIPNYFLSECPSFNQPLTIPSSVTSIGDRFLSDCSAFNSALTVSGTITTIGTYFMYYCRVFDQPLPFISSATSIGAYFLAGCGRFNQSVSLSNSLTSIPSNFLYSCSYFNQPIVVPPSVTSIGNWFIGSCVRFNQTITMSSGLTSIGGYFLYSCNAFDQSLTIPSTVTTIGTYFLAYCNTLNSPIIINGESLTSVGTYFMYSMRAFTSYVSVTGSSHAPTDNNSFSAYSTSVAAYTTGIMICGAWEGQVSSRTSSPYRKIVACSL